MLIFSVPCIEKNKIMPRKVRTGKGIVPLPVPFYRCFHQVLCFYFGSAYGTNV